MARHRATLPEDGFLRDDVSAEERERRKRDLEGALARRPVADSGTGLSSASGLTDGAAIFWSYAHSDDVAEGGRISRLAHLVAAEYELLRGEPLSLFIDNDSI